MALASEILSQQQGLATSIHDPEWDDRVKTSGFLMDRTGQWSLRPAEAEPPHAPNIGVSEDRCSQIQASHRLDLWQRVEPTTKS
ncbi:MAG: hypothetical protein ACK59A_00680 [Cyanobacteriota bacterium]